MASRKRMWTMNKFNVMKVGNRVEDELETMMLLLNMSPAGAWFAMLTGELGEPGR